MEIVGHIAKRRQWGKGHGRIKSGGRGIKVINNETRVEKHKRTPITYVRRDRVCVNLYSILISDTREVAEQEKVAGHQADKT